MISNTKQQMTDLAMDLISFVHRVALDEDASPAEISALPKIAAKLCVDRIVSTQNADKVRADLLEFARRVTLNKNASPAEIAALPEIVNVLFAAF